MNVQIEGVFAGGDLYATAAFMKLFLITAAGVFAGLMIFLVGVPIVLVAVALSSAGPEPVPHRTVLSLDLRQPLTDQDPHNPFAVLGRGGGLSVMSIIEALSQAETDDRVKGLFVRLLEGGMEPAMADEIGQAFGRFRAADKPIVAHSQGLYPNGAVTSTYQVGASASELWMQPGASFQVTGLAAEDLFFKRFFDRYGIVPQFEQRDEFKTAVNSFLQSDYTPAHREAQLSWMGSVYQTSLTAAAVGRKTESATLGEALEAGPYLAENALDLGLIDHLGQVREAKQSVLERAGAGAQLVEFDDYARNHRERHRRSGDVVALIEAEGAIVTSQGGAGSPFTGGSTIRSDDLADAILNAANTERVKAVVLRLNSPGGSDTASEQILDAVRQAKAAGKPVVVSMSSYGASGGYWIASEASAIVAQPSTLTGSIGVFGGKFALGQALARFGVDVRQTGVGATYASAFGLSQPFTLAQQASIADWIDRIYDNFIDRVARGRNLTPDRVREIARGRVWTGSQAKDLGLVDELGGFYQAVDTARMLAGLEDDVPLQRMTPTESTLEALQNALGLSAASARTLAAAAWVLDDRRVQALIEKVAEARLREHGAAVLAPTAGF